MPLPDNRTDRELEKFEDVDNEVAIRTIGSGGGFVTEKFDFVGLSYTGDNLTTATYKLGGSGGTTVATLTLAYTGDQLDSVTKT